MKWKRRALVTVVLLGLGVWGGLWGYGAWREPLVKAGCELAFPDLVSIEPPLRDPDVLRFVALGDTGTGSSGQRQVARLAQRLCLEPGCDFLLLLGDNVYPDGVASMDDPAFLTKIEQMYGPIGKPVYAVLGNHDVHLSGIFQVLHTLRSPTWRMPNFHYQFAAGPVQFHALNTNCSLLGWRWLNESLPQRDTLPWRVVFGHHTLQGTGSHGGADPATLWYWRRNLAPRVDYYLSGHNHSLEHLVEDGQRSQYVISGAGGWSGPTAGDHPIRSSDATPHFRSDEGGLAWMEFTAQQATLRFYDAQGTLLYENVRVR